jgi:hypothetical protein
MEVKCSASRQGHFTPGKRAPVPTGWGTGTVGGTEKNLCPSRLSNTGHAARNQLLHSLSYPGSQRMVIIPTRDPDTKKGD